MSSCQTHTPVTHPNDGRTYLDVEDLPALELPKDRGKAQEVELPPDLLAVQLVLERAPKERHGAQLPGAHEVEDLSIKAWEYDEIS